MNLYLKQKLWEIKIFLVVILQVTDENTRTGSVSQRSGSSDLDPYQNVTDPQHCLPIINCSSCKRSLFVHLQIIYSMSIYSVLQIRNKSFGSDSGSGSGRHLIGSETGQNFFFLYWNFYAASSSNIKGCPPSAPNNVRNKFVIHEDLTHIRYAYCICTA